MWGGCGMQSQSKTSGRFFRVPPRAVGDTRLTLEPMRVFLALCFHANTEFKAWPNYDILARLTNVRRNHISRAIKTLEKLEYVARKTIRKDFRRKTIYTVIYEPGAIGTSWGAN